MLRTRFSVLLIGAWLVSSALAQETVVISTGEYPPAYSLYSPHYGYTNHIVTEAFALADIEVDVQFMPWKRAYERARMGRIPATCCWFYTADRQANFHASDPIINEGFYFYHLKSFDFDWQDLDDLSDLAIGGTREYSYTDAFYQAIDEQRLTVEWVNSDLQSLRKLLAGRIDIVPIDKMVGEELLRSHFSPEERAQFTYHEKPLLDSNVHLLFPKTNDESSQDLLERFNEGLRQLKDSGRYDEILEAAMSGYYKQQSSHWRPDSAE